MIPLNAYHLLTTLAVEYQREVENVNKKEILKQINEIKYLSAQKTVPRLTLRREIVQLESKLQGIFELEKKILKNRKLENVKIGSLKRQVTILKKKLVASEDRNLHRKVDTLSHLLGENLAHKEIGEDVAFKKSLVHKKKTNVKQSTNPVNVEMFTSRLKMIKKELEKRKAQETDKDKVKKIEERISALENKLYELSHVVPVASSSVPRHTIKFDLPKDAQTPVSESELPLPPPPEMSG